MFLLYLFSGFIDKLLLTSFLLISLAVAEILVGFTVIVKGSYELSRHIGELDVNKTGDGDMLIPFQAAFPGTSMFFFLVRISLERAFALIWPLLNRVTSNKPYIYSAVIVWLAGITLGALILLVLYERRGVARIFSERRTIFQIQ